MDRWYAIIGLDNDTVTIGTFANCVSIFYERNDCAVLGPFKSANRAQLESETFKNME